MAKIIYERKKFQERRAAMIVAANEILEEYDEQGFDLTLRQLYYQFVSRDLLPNEQKYYTQLGDVVSDARMAGLIDWDHIVDRTRNLRYLNHWDDPAAFIADSAKRFNTDLWEDQEYRLEVWIEKDALIGVIAQTCTNLDVPYFSCRGYTSQSEMWSASQRLLEYIKGGQKVRILHLGDHDPSGIDMSRDIGDRLWQFTAADWLRHKRDDWADLSEANREVTAGQILNDFRDSIGVDRLALNFDQIQQYNPPPNPAKQTDSRFADYEREHGGDSWELDALEPTVMANLIRNAVEGYMDGEKYDVAIEKEQRYTALLRQVSQNWEKIEATLNGGSSAEE